MNHRIYFEFKNNVDLYVNHLKEKLNQEPYKSEKEKWKLCQNTEDVVCPIDWAQESSLISCKIAYEGVTFNSSLGYEYYNRTIDVVDERLIKAGVRLANILENHLKITFFQKYEMLIYSIILVSVFIIGASVFFMIFTIMYFRKEKHEVDSSYTAQVDEVELENTQHDEHQEMNQ